MKLNIIKTQVKFDKWISEQNESLSDPEYALKVTFNDCSQLFDEIWDRIFQMDKCTFLIRTLHSV